MKTLDDYLASTSTDEDTEEEASSATGSAPHWRASPAAPSLTSTTTATTVASPSAAAGVFPIARTPTTAVPRPNEARQRQDETRERMARLLGQDTVSNIAASVASGASEPSMTPVSAYAAGSAASPTMPFPNVTPATSSSQQQQRQSSQAGPAAAAAAAALDRTALPSPHSEPQYDRVQVMVVDRGTQTVSTVGTQTDPVWPAAGSPLGSTMPPPSMYMEPVLLPGRGGVRAWAPPIGSGGLGVDGRPYRQLVDDLAVKQAGDSVALREQLDMIQNSIDMLIARYNLPPPPK